MHADELTAAPGLKPALARLAESLVGLARTRAELAGVELVEERERLLLRVALLVGGVVVVALAALFTGLFIVALFWDTHRLGAIAVVALLYALGGALMIGRSKAIGREGPAPFAATFAEIEKDRVRLQRAAQDAAGGS
jgi:uncharacterized membrane protein YqjE